MAIDPRIALAVRAPNIAPAINIFENALMNAQTRDLRAQQEQRAQALAPFQLQQAQQGVDLGQQQITSQQSALDVESENRILKSVNDFAIGNASLIQEAQATQDPTRLRAALLQRKQQLMQQELPTQQTDEAVALIDAGQMGQVISGLGDAVTLFNQGRGRGRSAGQREFENLLRIVEDPNSTQIQKDSANRALGNKARATGSAAKTVDVGGVPHIFDPVRQTLVPASIGGANVTTQTIATSQADIAGAVTTAQEEAKVAPELRKQTQKQNSQRISELTRSEKARSGSVNKARRFLKAFESSAQSGASRSALSFLPGVFTTQAQFDEQFNAFSEVAARQQLKAAGETRPTDADVEGMKRAIFGVGRDEVTNINLLKEFINDQGVLDIELDELRDAKSLGKLSTFTGVPVSANDADVPEVDISTLSIEELIAERNRLGGQ